MDANILIIKNNCITNLLGRKRDKAINVVKFLGVANRPGDTNISRRQTRTVGYLLPSLL